MDIASIVLLVLLFLDISILALSLCGYRNAKKRADEYYKKIEDSIEELCVFLNRVL